jgi:hypothetical protein
MRRACGPSNPEPEKLDGQEELAETPFPALVMVQPLPGLASNFLSSGFVREKPS